MQGREQIAHKSVAALHGAGIAVGAVDSAYKQSCASDLTKRIADEDTRHDNLYTAQKNQVQMYLKFDFDKEIQEGGSVAVEHHQEVRHRRVGELLRGERQTLADAARVGDELSGRVAAEETGSGVAGQPVEDG
ncbi:MAG: hypothetical protein IJV36_04385 [Prevotella sp.]|nr:hypothetical protein [Prevotella sp.]